MIDLSELMDDPDFATPNPMTLITRRMTVNEHGEGVLSEGSQPVTGTVLPATATQLQRLPEGVRLQKAIQLWTKTKLFAKGEGDQGYSDVVVYLNERFVVQFLDDYSAWGTGFTKAVCTYEGPAQ